MYILHYMSLIDFLYPKVCLGCGVIGSYLCLDCIKHAPIATKVCVECQKASIDGLTHSRCKRKRSLNGLFSIWKYNGVIRKVLIKLKFKYVYLVSSDIARFSVFYLKRSVNALPKNATLVPIPLYRTRKNIRGFNQTEEIGKLIARNMGWIYEKDLLIRVKKAKIQSELSKKERAENVRGIFSLNCKYLIHDTAYILFDDIRTTGSTLKEACKVLKTCLRRQGNGAEVVWGLTIAG